MSFYSHLFFVSGTLFAFMAVVAGAFGAHFLKTRLSIENLVIYETAVHYQMYHALALIVVAFASHFFNFFWLNIAGTSFIVGTIVFCGSLFLLVFSNIKAWGAVTPIGGLFFLIGWLSLLISSFR